MVWIEAAVDNADQDVSAVEVRRPVAGTVDLCEVSCRGRR
jgi:multidrug resistance efflux pump